jgi:RNA polymerase primary sigma factor
VVNVAFLYRNQGLSLPELINEGNIGLVEAANRFDTSRDLKFISYAVWWIRQSITRAIAEKARVVRISAEKELVLRRFSKVNHPTSQAIGGAWVTDSVELGRRMEMSAEAVEKVIEMGQRHSSLDSKLDEEGDSSLIDVLQDEEAILPDAHAEANDEMNNLQAMIAELPETERKVLCMYFGIGYGEAFNLQEIGKVVGLSKERVRQIKEKALARMREQAHELAMAA